MEASTGQNCMGLSQDAQIKGSTFIRPDPVFSSGKNRHLLPKIRRKNVKVLFPENRSQAFWSLGLSPFDSLFALGSVHTQSNFSIKRYFSDRPSFCTKMVNIFGTFFDRDQQKYSQNSSSLKEHQQLKNISFWQNWIRVCGQSLKFRCCRYKVKQ